MALATRPILALMSIVSLRVIASLGTSIQACLMVSSTLGVTKSGSSQMGIWQTGGSYSFFFFFDFFFFFLGAICTLSVQIQQSEVSLPFILTTPILLYPSICHIPYQSQQIKDSLPKVHQFGQFPILDSRLIERFLSAAFNRLLVGQHETIFPGVKGGTLVDDPQGYLLVLLVDFLLPSESLFVHGHHIAVLLPVYFAFLCCDDLVEEYLVC